MADISKITIGGTAYNIKDAVARAQLANLGSAVAGGIRFLGITTTVLTDHAVASNVTIGESEVKAENGDLVLYDSKEFLCAKTGAAGALQWNELGRGDKFGTLAFKNNASGSVSASHEHSYTHTYPTHTVTQGTVNASGSFTPAGTNAASAVTFTAHSTSAFVKSYPGSAQKLVTTKIPSITTGTVHDTPTASKENFPHKVLKSTSVISGITPSTIQVAKAGSPVTVATGSKTTANAITALNTASVPNVTSVGTMFKAEVSGEALVLTAGSVPTLGSAITVATSAKSTAAAIIGLNTTSVTPAIGGTSVIAGIETTAKDVFTMDAIETTVVLGATSPALSSTSLVTGITEGTAVSVAKPGSEITVATGAISATGTGASVLVGLGSPSTGTAITALGTGTAAAQKFTGTAGSVSVSGKTSGVSVEDHKSVSESTTVSLQAPLTVTVK